MASEFSELDAAGHLESGEAFLDDAARLLDGGARPGWVVTAAFYSALHVVSAYVLARHRAQVVAHRDRARKATP